MLFDLRSRGRRRTVQVVYLGLAILFGLGLVLFGVGTGSGGGLLNAFTGNGSSSGQNSAVSSQEKAAIKQTQTEPNNPTAWANLINARNSTAQLNSQETTTGVPAFNAKGKQELAAITTDWQRYLALNKTPGPDITIIAAHADEYQSNYAGAAQAWGLEAASSPTEAKGFLCYALNAYAAKQTRTGDLAKTKALALTPKAERKEITGEIAEAQVSPSTAQQC